MNDLTVFCDSVEGVILYKSNDTILTTMRWCVHEDDPGFEVENADFLVDVYLADFYVLDAASTLQFIINAAERIKKDHNLKSITYLDSVGNQTPLPMFMPNTISDDEVAILPSYQLSLHNAWREFVQVCNYALSDEFMAFLDSQDVLIGFLDLVNAELSLLRQHEMLRDNENE